MKKIRIATRKSTLALWQTHFVRKKLLDLFPKLQIEIIGINTQGDKQKEIQMHVESTELCSVGLCGLCERLNDRRSNVN